MNGFAKLYFVPYLSKGKRGLWGKCGSKENGQEGQRAHFHYLAGVDAMESVVTVMEPPEV